MESRGSKVTVFWDGKQVLNYDGLEKTNRNFLTFWVNYTEATYRNIKLTATDGKVLFEDIPGDVQIPAVAQQWTAFGDGGKYRLVKDDAVNMRYSRRLQPRRRQAFSKDRRISSLVKNMLVPSMPRLRVSESRGKLAWALPSVSRLDRRSRVMVNSL